MRRLSWRWSCVALLSLAGMMMQSCADADAPLPAAHTKSSVLIIGDATVVTPQLANILNAMGHGLRDTLDVQLMVQPGWDLVDHYLAGLAPSVIRQGGWEYVVLQDAPIISGDVRLLVETWAGKFRADVAASGGRLAIFNPYAGVFSVDFTRSQSSIGAYDLIATSLAATPLRVGSSWAKAWSRDQTLPFFQADGVSPSTLANYLSAMVIYSSLTGARVSDLPVGVRLAAGDSISFTPTVMAVMRAAAADAITGK